VGGPKVAAPLGCHVAAGLQARPPDGGNAVLEPLRKADRGGFRSSTPSPSTAHGGA
jgi:hypothetical protein